MSGWVRVVEKQRFRWQKTPRKQVDQGAKVSP